jgi:cyclohexanecarboxylate-CoA ligase
MTAMVSPADYVRPGDAAGDLSALRGYTVADRLAANVRRHPNAPALVDGAQHWTWREWEEAARDLAARWRHQGVTPGAVVGLHLPSSAALALCHTALAYLGAVSAMVHRPYTAVEANHLLLRVEATGRLTGDGEATPGLEKLAGMPATERAPSEEPPAADHPLALFFTSGTESPRPKACLHTHDGLLSNAAWVADDIELAPSDTIVSASAFTHLFGCLALHLSLVTGARQVVLRRFDAERLWMLAARQQADIVFVVPAQLHDLVGWRRRHPEAPRWRVRELRVAGSYLPAGLAQTAEDVLEAPVVNHWGMSELGAGTYGRRSDPPAVAHQSIGRPTRGSHVSIVDADGTPIREPGRIGSLLFRGPSLFQGYLGDRAATQAAFVASDGYLWFRTGDLARWTAEGCVAYAGRSKDLINRGGMKISAQEVEAALLTLPAVRQAAVLAEPDERLGERALLAVSLVPGAHLDLDAVRRHLEAEGLARFKWPERLVVLNDLPTTPTGKVAKASLRALLDIGSSVS